MPSVIIFLMYTAIASSQLESPNIGARYAWLMASWQTPGLELRTSFGLLFHARLQWLRSWGQIVLFGITDRDPKPIGVCESMMRGSLPSKV